MAEHEETGTLDWAAARERLARIARTAENADSLSPEQAHAVLEARARELARVSAPEKAVGELLEVARFTSSGQTYALETRFVHEVLRSLELTPLPGAPGLLRGLTLLRGEVLPVVELAPLFGRPASGQDGMVLTVGATRADLGLRVEAVEEVMLVPREALLPPPTTLPAEAVALVSGIHRDGTLVLEGAALLGDSRLVFDLSDEGNP